MILQFHNGLTVNPTVVQVKSIKPNSLAARDGRIEKGDRIISINGKLREKRLELKLY